MTPQELVDRLIKATGKSQLAVAKEMDKPGFQGTLHKFVSGTVASPTHETAAKIARYFEIPIEALYQESVASQVAATRGLISSPPVHASAHGAPLTAAQDLAAYQVPRDEVFPLSSLERQLLLDLRELLDDDQKSIAQLTHQRAERVRAYVAHAQRKRPKSMAARVDHQSSETRLTHGDGNEHQGSLAFVSDDHPTGLDSPAAKAAREDSMYTSIEHAWSALPPIEGAHPSKRRDPVG